MEQAYIKCNGVHQNCIYHYNDVIMSAMASQITGVLIVYSTVCSGSDQRKHQRFAPLAIVRGILRSPVNSPHKEPVTWKMFPFDDVIMHVQDVCLPRALNRVIFLLLGPPIKWSPRRCRIRFLLRWVVRNSQDSWTPQWTDYPHFVGWTWDQPRFYSSLRWWSLQVSNGNSVTQTGNQ